MKTPDFWTVAVFAIFLGLGYSNAERQCTSQDYVNCVKMADPLLTEPTLIFPDKLVDIDDLCRRWRQFVQCVKTYTSRCFTETQQQDFIKAVESPVDLVHQMCTETQYQLEYLQHAPCIQSTITRDGLCTRTYQQLVEQVLGDVDQSSLCCSHHHFHECVLGEVRRRCNIADGGESATKFTQEILDKSMNFLQARCYDYDYKSRECSQRMLPTNMYNGVLNQNDTNSKKDNSFNDNSNTMPIQQHRSTNSMVPQQPEKETPPFWQSGQDAERSPVRPQHPSNTEPSDGTSRDPHLRYRNSSYGRGIYWPPSSPQTPNVNSQEHERGSADNTVQTTLTTEPWYPSVFNDRRKINNAVDEPNQQGLSHSGTGVQTDVYTIILSYFITMLMMLVVQ
ncbi:uncharacterized protein [Anabrus simplex]|uniref:uncharacterized protein n=1 Tax=Anabrus simplex TaxID=316456 RepID=UPI0035A2C956